MLLLQYVPGHNLFDEKEAFQPENLSSACHALGAVFGDENDWGKGSKFNEFQVFE